MSTEQTNQPTLMDAPQAEQPKTETTTAVAKKEKYTPELCASAISKLPAQLQALKNCFAQPFDAFRRSFKDPAEADRIMAREIDFAAQAMMANNYLIKVATANPMSLVNALKNVGQARTTLNPSYKLAYLVPMAGAICFWPSYMGIIDSLVNCGAVRKIEAHPVFKGDEFRIAHGSKEQLIHNPDISASHAKDNLQCVYYFAILADGTEQFDYMNVEEIENTRKRSPSAKSTSPWDTDYIQMCRKTLIRRAWNVLPKTKIAKEKLEILQAMFDYDEKAEQSWIAEQKATPKKDSFDEDEVEYEEVN